MQLVDYDAIALRAAETCRAAGIVIDPKQQGPVPLNTAFMELGVLHVSLPDLTSNVVARYLNEQGVMVGDVAVENQTLAGFLFTSGEVGWAFVNANDILQRRRFTAAHELGHFVLHRDQMTTGYLSDTAESILENILPEDLKRIEQEANHFAVEFLMPASICRARAEALRREHGSCPRSVLGYRLAAELLVSREAMRYRLQALELGDE